MAPYHFSVTVHGDFEEAVGKTRAALTEHGFGIVSEIDMAATLKEKLGVETEPYLILGACNPVLANQALTHDETIGLLLDRATRAVGRRLVEAPRPGATGKPGTIRLQTEIGLAAKRTDDIDRRALRLRQRCWAAAARGRLLRVRRGRPACRWRPSRGRPAPAAVARWSRGRARPELVPLRCRR